MSTLTAVLGWCWPAEVLLVEADPAGGALGGWWDLPAAPGLSSLAADPATAAGEWPAIVTHLQPAPVSPRVSVLVAPVRTRDAAVVVPTAVGRIVPTITALSTVHAIADLGRYGGHVAGVVDRAAVTVIIVRQPPDVRNAAVVFERVAGLTDTLPGEVLVVVAGERPYRSGEIERYVARPCLTIADDPAAAYTVRTGGVPARSKLFRSVTPMAAELHRTLLTTTPAGSGVGAW